MISISQVGREEHTEIVSSLRLYITNDLGPVMPPLPQHLQSLLCLYLS